MKARDIREMKGEELMVKGRELREEFFKLKFQHGIRQLENTGKLRELRKDIARIETVLNEKQA